MQLGIERVKLSNRDIKRIYFDAFPKNERMPFLMMVAMSKLWNTQFLSFYDEDIPCGFAYFALNRKIIFVMFLAVDESVRSNGKFDKKEFLLFFILYSNGTVWPKIWMI